MSDNEEGNKVKPFRYHTPRNQQGPKEWNRPESSQKVEAFHSSPSETCFPQLCASELIITLAGASPASHGGRRKVERSEEGKGWVSGATARAGDRWCYATTIGFSLFYPADRNPQERKSWRISVFQTHAFSIVLRVMVLVCLLLPGFGNVNFWDVQEDIVAIYKLSDGERGREGPIREGSSKWSVCEEELWEPMILQLRLKKHNTIAEPT